jgi:hypothetical protein
MRFYPCQARKQTELLENSRRLFPNMTTLISMNIIRFRPGVWIRVLEHGPINIIERAVA